VTVSIFGDLERFLSEDLYPYRWPLAIGLLVAAAFLLLVAYRQGWHRWIWRHRLTSAVIAIPLMAIVAVGGYPLVSPLFTRNTVCEASPIAGAGAGSEKCQDQAALASTEKPTPASSAGSTPAPATTAPTDPPSFEARALLKGQFRNADSFHTGSGDAIIIETLPETYTLRFENFSVRNGPDLYVYLSPDADGYTDDSLELGVLKGTDGAFNYELPAGTDISQYKSALVWCKAFSVLFTVAPLDEP